MTKKKAEAAQDLEIKLYTLQQIADAMNLSRRTLYRYLKAGKLTATKIGYEWRVTEENLVRFLNGN